MAKRYRAIVEGKTISKHRDIGGAVVSIMEHFRTHEHLLLPEVRNVEAFIALGEDVVVDLALQRIDGKGMYASLDWVH